jgi:hypothetical protein
MLFAGDGQLKQEGMRNIGACLKHSKSMLVLWDPTPGSAEFSTFFL